MTDAPRDSDYSLGPALDFLRRIWQLNHTLERASRRMEKALGVTAEQRFLLRCVGRFPGITPGDVARILHIDPGTVSSTVRRLESKGLVERRRAPGDNRRVALGLTAKGHALDIPVEHTVESAAEKLLAAANAHDVDLALSLLAALTRLLDQRDGS